MRMATHTRGSLLRSGFAALIFSAAAPAFAGTAWNEGVDGDLSSDGLAPTALSFSAGANTVIGSMGGGDIDYFRFTVPAGALLTALNVNPGTAVSGAQSFLAIQAGPQVTVTPTGGGTGPGSLLAFSHYDASDIGTNLLARLLPSPVGLEAGTYSIWLNETAGSVPYSFDFVLTAVPEPGAAGLLLLGLCLLAFRHHRSQACENPG